MARRRARPDLHQLRRGAPLRRARALVAARRPRDRGPCQPAGPVHALAADPGRSDRRGDEGARPVTRPSWRAIGRALAARRSTFLLLAVAAVPFLPVAIDLLRHGLPDVLFSGDGAVLEIRTLHAVHGRQLLGPYSRFLWSHPGPAFFYLAAPFYRLSHLRGSGINLAVLCCNFGAATALVFTARRLRGNLFAFAVGVLLAIYEAIGAPFPLWGEWNPMTPILPLALLFFLAARLGGGSLGALPAVALVASAIVET